jgi:hypothetical protein
MGISRILSDLIGGMLIPSLAPSDGDFLQRTRANTLFSLSHFSHLKDVCIERSSPAPSMTSSISL